MHIEQRAGVRMLHGQPTRMQKQPFEPITLPVKLVESAFAVRRVAENMARTVIEVAANLVVTAGENAAINQGTTTELCG